MVTPDWEDSLLGPEPGGAVMEVPSVVAVVVTSDPDDRFDAVLASLAAQDYPSLTVLVVDAGSQDDLSARIGAVVPDAFVRRLPERIPFAAAANEGLAAVQGANYLLFCTDDVELAPDALSLLVEEAFRSNAGIVGPKFVDSDRSELLVEVGLAADKLGVPARLVDPGEVDHEQHDAVRDVFAVPHAAMLVRADLCAELEGFDDRFTAGIEEVDLCWRARLAGARVMVVPDAVARRPLAALEARYGTDPDRARAEEPANRLHMLVRNYSVWSLVRVLPQAALVTAVQALALIFVGRPRRSWSVVRAWVWNARRLPATLRERRRVQALRALPDRDVRSFQVHGFSYARAFFAGQLDLGGRVDSLSGRGRDLAVSMTGGVRRAAVTFGVVLVAVVAVGSRDLVTSGVPAVGSFLPWPSPTVLVREFTSAWRFAGVGSSAPAPPAFVLMGAFSTVLGGAEGLARTAVIVGAIPLGAYGAFRMMMPLARSVWAPVAAATAYAVVPLPRNAIASGRLGSLVFYALAPLLVTRVLQAAGIPPYGGGEEDDRPRPDRRRSMLATAILLAVTGACYPAAVVLVPMAAAVLVVASPLAGGRLAAVSALFVSVAAAALAVALLFPWSVGLLVPVPDLGALGVAFRERPDFVEALLFDTGPARVGIAGLLLAVAAQPLVIGSGERLRWAVRAWAIAFAGWLAAWLPGRLGAPVLPEVEGTLVLAAVGVAMAVGLGSGVLREELERAGLSWRQGVAVLSLGALVVASFPMLADALDGRWQLPGRDWHGALTWMESERADGGFRVLWVGDPAELPGHPLRLEDGTGFAVSRGGPGDARELWPAPAEGGTAHVRHAVEAAVAGRTDRLGHLLGPLGIRFVAFPLTPSPGRVRIGDEVPVTRLQQALSQQVDLAGLSVDPGIRLYENRAWMPATALVDGETAETLTSGERSEALLVDLSGARPVSGGPRDEGIVRVEEGDRDRVTGVLVLAEPYDADWEATADGALRPHLRVLGLVNGFEVEDVDRVDVEHGGQLLRYGALGVQLVVWLFVVGAWRRRRAEERMRWRAYRESLRDVRPRARPVPVEAPA